MNHPPPKFFKKPIQFKQWLEKNHNKETELWIGFYKTKSGKEGATYKEALDIALCYGWIDAVRQSIDEVSYTIRFTPRKPTSIWSNVNIKRVGELIELGLMQAPGLEAFSKRIASKSGIYSFEQSSHELDAQYEKKFRANKKAWTFFMEQAPWYRRTTYHWIMRAKRKETRVKRLNELITDSANGKRLKQFSRP